MKNECQTASRTSAMSLGRIIGESHCVLETVCSVVCTTHQGIYIGKFFSPCTVVPQHVLVAAAISMPISSCFRLSFSGMLWFYCVTQITKTCVTSVFRAAFEVFVWHQYGTCGCVLAFIRFYKWAQFLRKLFSPSIPTFLFGMGVS